MPDTKIDSINRDVPHNSEHYVLEWLSQPDKVGYRKSGAQSFNTKDKAVEYMIIRLEMGHTFVSLHKETTIIDDLTAEVLDLLQPVAEAAPNP